MTQQSNDPMTDIVVQLQALKSSLDTSLNTIRDALDICLNSIMVDIVALKPHLPRDDGPP